MAAGSAESIQALNGIRPFNGAATRWPRDLGIAVGTAAIVAPSMGPRPDGRGISKIPAPSLDAPVLQWGRDQMAAGSILTARNREGNHIPSMGPRPDGRGIHADHRAVCRGSHPSMGPRPDGRGIRRGRRWVRRRLRSFNGAATRWPRDHPLSEPTTPFRISLQWGRDQMAAGSSRW